VTARKPAQSFSPGDPVTDADILGRATGQDPEAVCPPHRRYPVALAPPMAAAALGLPGFRISDLSREAAAGWPAPPVDVGLVEGAGGVASPQADDGDTTALISALAPERVVLVADAALGTINLVRLCLRALGGGRPVTVHLNRFDAAVDVQRRNRDWLAGPDGLEVTTTIAELANRVAGTQQ
jgi:dethiobiotin synthetase